MLWIWNISRKIREILWVLVSHLFLLIKWGANIVNCFILSRKIFSIVSVTHRYFTFDQGLRIFPINIEKPMFTFYNRGSVEYATVTRIRGFCGFLYVLQKLKDVYKRSKKIGLNHYRLRIDYGFWRISPIQGNKSLCKSFIIYVWYKK